MSESPEQGAELQKFVDAIEERQGKFMEETVRDTAASVVSKAEMLLQRNPHANIGEYYRLGTKKLFDIFSDRAEATTELVKLINSTRDEDHPENDTFLGLREHIPTE